MRILIMLIFVAAAIYFLWKFYNSTWLNEFKVNTYEDNSVDSIKTNIKNAEQVKETNLNSASTLAKTKEAELKELKELQGSDEGK